MPFPRKENRPGKPATPEGPRRSEKSAVLPWGRRPLPVDASRGRPCDVPRGGTAPFISRAHALPLLLIFLATLLIFSFQTPSSPAAAGEVAPTLLWPARGEVLVPFRPSTGPYGSGGHSGIDISLAAGSEVRASAAGRVSFAGGTPVGACVSIVHPGGVKTTYVSLRAAAVRGGQEVSGGQLIGSSDGSRDRSSSAPHLHFGLFINGRAVDPLPFLQGRLLDPGECLFLGPWEDVGAMKTFLDRHKGEGGLLDSLGRGCRAIGRVAVNACKAVGRAVGGAMKEAWKWTCKLASAAGRAAEGFYRSCIEPWFSPLWEKAATAAKWVLSNRYVQAVLAGLAAAALICLAVTGIGLAIGLSIATMVTAAVAGSIAAVGYAVYYASACGDSFTFLGCFLSSLAVGGAVAGSCLLFSYMAPLIGSGWSNLGLLGFGKAFVVHGLADSVSYAFFCAVTGREISPLGVLASFLIGGLIGGVGKLFASGLLSGGAVQTLAAGFISSGGGTLAAGGLSGMTTYLGAMFAAFAQRVTFVLFCGCTGFLGDVTIRALTGKRPSLLESGLAFAGGALAGGMNLIGGGKGLSSLLGRLSGGRIEITSDLARAMVGKFLSRGLKEGLSGLLRRLTARESALPEVAWWSD